MRKILISNGFKNNVFMTFFTIPFFFYRHIFISEKVRYKKKKNQIKKKKSDIKKKYVRSVKYLVNIKINKFSRHKFVFIDHLFLTIEVPYVFI